MLILLERYLYWLQRTFLEIEGVLLAGSREKPRGECERQIRYTYCFVNFATFMCTKSIVAYNFYTGLIAQWKMEWQVTQKLMAKKERNMKSTVKYCNVNIFNKWWAFQQWLFPVHLIMLHHITCMRNGSCEGKAQHQRVSCALQAKEKTWETDV